MNSRIFLGGAAETILGLAACGMFAPGAHPVCFDRMADILMKDGGVHLHPLTAQQPVSFEA